MSQESYFVYQKKEQGICIIRCYAKESRILIPDTIEGMPVTELAPYAFAAQMEEEPENPGDFPCICGESLEELILPKSILRIGRYVFYNCWNFWHFSFYSNIAYIGSGSFTGCKKLSHLSLQEVEEQKPCLREVLEELNQTVKVFWQRERECAALFPAFFEEAVENTPARIIETHTHGVGIQYRNAFKNTRMNWKEYDRLFEVGKYNMERAESIYVTLYRLRYPVELEGEAREEYDFYLRNHIKEAAEVLSEQGEKALLFWMAEHFVETQRELELILQVVQQDIEAVSFLMDLGHNRFYHKKDGTKKEKRGFSL
ncbi:MAG: leucine-rich repeat protein [Lachnospiraceae bacterium]|nr:leucine-rich repeat protein [Lachnospiraceae bacterium]